MIIQFNTDNNMKHVDKWKMPLEEIISDGIDRFSSQITRIEVHLSDENGNKEGINDKRCLLEARLEGRQPIAVSNTGNTHEQAVEGATAKLISFLDSIVGKERNI